MTLSRPSCLLPGSTPDKAPLVRCDRCNLSASTKGGVFFGPRFMCSLCVGKKLNRSAVGKQIARAGA